MFKHIIGQSIFQVIVMLILIFLGDKFIPEFPDSFDNTVFAGHPEYKYHEGIVGGTVRSGREIFINGDDDYHSIFE